MPRLNKNGIPILDPPNAIGRRQHRTCIPGEHRWGKSRQVNHSDRVDAHFLCRRCGDTMVETQYLDQGYWWDR